MFPNWRQIGRTLSPPPSPRVPQSPAETAERSDGTGDEAKKPDDPRPLKNLPFIRLLILVSFLLGLLLSLWLGVRNTHAAQRTTQTDLATTRWAGFAILIIPFLALPAILRGGKWNWNVVKQVGGEDLSWSKTLSAIVWLGWLTGLIVGTLRICGLA